jgi:dienelactone hydrolase
MSDCCVKGSEWHGTPNGQETTLARNNTYVTGSNEEVAILVIHDLFGWTFPNLRLLADHYASKANATVYLPDFFGGEILPSETLQDETQWGKLDIPGFLSRNSKAIREPEIFECARALRSQYKRIAAVGFCFGGWAVFRLGGKDVNLVDCISTAHPTLLEKSEIQNVDVPVQIMAPEFDPMFTPELKEFCNKVVPTLGVPYDYQYFPGLHHAFATKGDPENGLENKGMERAKNAAVHWFQQWLHLH